MFITKMDVYIDPRDRRNVERLDARLLEEGFSQEARAEVRRVLFGAHNGLSFAVSYPDNGDVLGCTVMIYVTHK